MSDNLKKDTNIRCLRQLNNWVLESMDEGKVTGLLFVDISKAFDSLNHKVLLRKLNHLGVSERSLRCSDHILPIDSKVC